MYIYLSVSCVRVTFWPCVSSEPERIGTGAAVKRDVANLPPRGTFKVEVSFLSFTSFLSDGRGSKP